MEKKIQGLVKFGLFFDRMSLKKPSSCNLVIFIGHGFYESPVNQPSSVPLRSFFLCFRNFAVFWWVGVLPVHKTVLLFLCVFFRVLHH